jgi:hypothetical protein
MSHINKNLTERDANQTLQSSYNDVDATLSVNGFLVGKVGNRITLALSTTTIANDTEIYTFLDNGTQLYIFTLVYTDGTRTQLISATRTA